MVILPGTLRTHSLLRATPLQRAHATTATAGEAPCWRQARATTATATATAEEAPRGDDERRDNNGNGYVQREGGRGEGNCGGGSSCGGSGDNGDDDNGGGNNDNDGNDDGGDDKDDDVRLVLILAGAVCVVWDFFLVQVYARVDLSLFSTVS